MYRNTNTFARNQNVPVNGPSGTSAVQPPILIGCGPPRNNVTMIALIVIVFMNSARKKSAKRMDEYSVLNPPTSSCSASTRSKGGRFNSAVAASMKITKGMTPVATMFQLRNPPCPSTIPFVDMVPASRKMVATERPRAAS
uniref:Unannotated protein n=1 Tax=freshwater metagenome TaxID=449393 RepID=A0A6J7P2P8_9ZZZZ